jgi:hypothetical protein
VWRGRASSAAEAVTEGEEETRGGVGGGTIYDSPIFPIQWGSGGSGATGGAGGGRIYLTVFGTFTLDGAMSATGNAPTNTSHGAGSGGSIRLNVGRLVGGGTITADGGSTVDGGATKSRSKAEIPFFHPED